MIEIKELRIGNIIMEQGVDYNHGDRFHDPDGDEPLTVAWENLGYIHDRPQDYDPIPLTAEWLRKCGFGKVVYIGCGELLYWAKKNGYYFGANDNEYGFDYDNASRIDYVHQLQNLYFALIEWELEINLKA